MLGPHTLVYKENSIQRGKWWGSLSLHVDRERVSGYHRGWGRKKSVDTSVLCLFGGLTWRSRLCGGAGFCLNVMGWYLV